MAVYVNPPDSSRSFNTATSDDVFLLTGRDSLFLARDSGSVIGLLGQSNRVDILASAGTDIVDLGQGSAIDFINGVFGSSNIYGFQFDTTGIVLADTRGPFSFNFTNGTAGTPLPSDGHGGSIFTYAPNGSSLDFRGDPHVVINGTIPVGANV